MAMITRTIVKDTNITFRTVIDGEVSAPQSITVDGMVGNPAAIVKKQLGLKKTDSVIIDAFVEDSHLFGCTVEEFLSVAHRIQNRPEISCDRNPTDK